MRIFKRTLLAGAVALAVSTPAAAQFSNIYSFGDSLTDVGSFKPILPGMFTTNPGPVWAIPFAEHFGLTSSPANKGGNNYAYGGANVTATPGYPDVPPIGSAVPIATQVSQFLAKGPVDPNAIYTVWGMGNDLNATLEKVFLGQMTQAQAQAYMATVARDYVTQVARLAAAGAKYIMVFDIPDVGKSPDAVESGQAATITAFTDYVNGTVRTGLNQLGVQTIRVNTFKFLDEVMANPAAYGFTNSTTRACGAVPAPLCTPANLVTPNAAQTYIYADGHHPTTAMHALLAQYFESMIDGPQQIGALADAPFRAEDAGYRALDGRMWSNLNAPRTGKRFEAWAAYDYGSIDMGAGPTNATGNTNTVALGGDMKVNDRTLAGLMFAYTENKADFGGAGGGFKLKQPVFTGYVGYGEGPWYVGATLGAGSLDYSNVTRNIALGQAMRSETGETRGYEYTGRLLGGYWFKYQDLVHGPYARMTYTKAVVRQYSESGADSTALTFGQQNNEQLLWSVGWQASGNWSGIRPWARVTWEYDSLDKNRDVSASSVTLGGWYSIPAPKPDNSYALFNLGAAADFGGVTGYISGSGTAARGDYNYWAVTVGIRMPL